MFGGTRRRTAWVVAIIGLSMGALAPAAATSVPGFADAPAGAVELTPGLARLVATGSTDRGPAAGTVHLTLALPFRDAGAVAALVAARTRSVSPAPPLTAAQFDARYAPAASTVAAVVAWASSAGLTVDNVASNRLLVSVSGPAGAVGTAFGTTLHQLVTATGLSYIAASGPSRLPAALAGRVTAVLGLNSLARMTRSATTGPPLGGLGPQDLWSFYDAPGALTGAGETMAVLAEGDLTGVIADLRKFENTFGLAQAPVSTRLVDGGSTDTTGSAEFDLDTQYSTGFAPSASLVVYDGRSLNNADVADEVNAFVADNTARQGSFSAGECEVLAQVSGMATAVDAALQQAVAQGQTLFTSSGDSGAFCPAVVGVNGAPAGLPNVAYPAASPGAIGVGGTTIAGLPSPAREIAWFGSGGGPSLFETQPAFQAGAGGTLLPLQRGVPDVALDADPLTGYKVIVGGTQQIIGGTSAGAPSWLGIWTRAQSAHPGLGFAGPVLYRLPATAFNDIVVGTNVPYPAAPGWDYVTGRGTPDITAVVNGA